MSNSRPLLAAVLACALLLPAASPEPKKAGMDSARLAEIPQRLKSYVDKGLLPGIVTLVERRGALACLDAVGYLDIEQKIPLKTDSIFEVMSMTKPVTSTAIMILAEEGRLALTDPVEKYLPEFRGQWMIISRDKESHAVSMKKPSRAITIRDLLTHTSGMPEMPPEGMGGVGFYFNMNHTLAEAVIMYSQLPLEFEPGTKWSYSNTGMATLGRIVEVVSDQPFEKFLDARIFQPLGMKDSFIFPPPEKYSRIASGYQMDHGKLKNLGDTKYRKGFKYSMPEGGMYATAADMALFYRMMLDGGTLNGKRILSKASVDVMTSVHTGDLSPTWGLGWSVAAKSASTLPLASIGTYSHGGALGTYGWVDPKKELIGVFMTQRLNFEESETARSAFQAMATSAIVE